MYGGRICKATSIGNYVFRSSHHDRSHPKRRLAFDGGQNVGKAVRLLNDGIGNRVVGIRKNEIIDMDIIEAVSMKKKFNYELYETLQMISM